LILDGGTITAIKGSISNSSENLNDISLKLYSDLVSVKLKLRFMRENDFRASGVAVLHLTLLARSFSSVPLG
jgi:hypothetical protein